jgi:hypothetical protein
MKRTFFRLQELTFSMQYLSRVSILFTVLCKEIGCNFVFVSSRV